MALRTVVGGTDSDSYVTVAEADVLIDSLPDDPTAWGDLEEGQKEYRLRLAADLLGFFSWRGSRVFCEQSLSFPRTVQSDVWIIPDEVKETQVFLAYSVVHRYLLARPDPTEPAQLPRELSSIELGGLLRTQFAAGVVGTASGTLLDQLTASPQFPAFLRMRRYLTQFRGGVVLNSDEVTPCLTTTTTTT